MRGVLKLTWIEMKLFFREPTAAFFTLLFPPLMLLLFGSIFGNKPSLLFGGIGYADTAVPAFTAMIIATSGILTLTIHVASYREKRILRRLQATPLRPQALLVALVTVVFFMTALGMILMTVVGKFLYGVTFSGNLTNFVLAFVLSCMSIFVLGFVLSGLLPTARTAQIVAMGLFYPMILLSGATVPMEILPDGLRKYNQLLPLTQVVTLLRGFWVGEGWSEHWQEVFFLSSLLLIGFLVSAKTFRWD